MFKALGGDDGVKGVISELEVFGLGDDGDVVCGNDVVAVILAVVEQKAVVSVDITRADVEDLFVSKVVGMGTLDKKCEIACLAVHV